MKILILDQFAGITPYSLSHAPKRFDDLCAEELAKPKSWHQPARVLDADEQFYAPEMCTTVLREGAGGMAEVWRYRWDSSG